MSIETDIIEEIQRILREDVKDDLDNTLISSIHYEKIKLATGDFQTHEIPAAQLWDVGQTIQHERGRIRVTWSLSIELITKSTSFGTADQATLIDLRRRTQLALWAQPNLGIPGVVHLVYNGNVTDLHLLDPFLIARLDFDAVFYDNLTGSC